MGWESHEPGEGELRAVTDADEGTECLAEIYVTETENTRARQDIRESQGRYIQRETASKKKGLLGHEPWRK